jgi:hypothetical protein
LGRQRNNVAGGFIRQSPPPRRSRARVRAKPRWSSQSAAAVGGANWWLRDLASPAAAPITRCLSHQRRSTAADCGSRAGIRSRCRICGRCCPPSAVASG